MGTKTNFDTQEAIIKSAANTVRKDGYSAISFRNLADDIGVKSSTVHYFFPTKGDLADALIDRFSTDFSKFKEPLLEMPVEDALEAYIGLHKSGFDGSSKICIGAMMSAEVTALQESSRERLEGFVKMHTDFIGVLLKKKHPRLSGEKLHAKAFAIFTALEGAQVMTRGLGGDVKIFDQVIDSYKAAGLFG